MEQSTNKKITYGLERLSKAFRVLLWEESKQYKISPIQIQILIFCSTHKQEDLKVGFLANEFDLTKATISDSVKVLIKKGLLLKKVNLKDSRSFTVALTNEGKKIVQNTHKYSAAIDEAINKLPEENQTILLNSILHVIHELNQKEIISTQRMCLTCHYYCGNTERNHFCKLLNKPLKSKDLQIDCSDHKTK